MVTEKAWEEFREIGLLWWINSILHMFGWALTYEYETYDEETGTGIIKRVYPARVKYRGFDEAINTDGYKKVAKYLKNNINILEKETQE